MRRGGFTMVEMMLVTAISASLMLIVASLYAFTTYRTAHSIATTNVSLQVRAFADFIENTVQNANSCVAVSNGGNKALKCIMPTTGLATNSYGLYSSYKPASGDSSGLHWGQGNRRWIYWSNTGGNFLSITTGTILWVSETTDDTLPVLANAYSNFTYYYGNAAIPNWDLIDTFTFSTNSSANQVTFTVSASDMIRTGASSTTARSTDAASSRVFSITRTVTWRHGQT